MWHAESLVAACELLVMACGISFPNQGSNLGPLHWERVILATGLPEDLPDPGIEPTSPALAGEFLTTEPPGKPLLRSK